MLWPSYFTFLNTNKYLKSLQKMANYNKSFNFRNGVQVDDDNFIVNANGLVGIGTSIPTEFLDVHGTAKITGLVTATNLAITGVSTFYSDVKVGSGITFMPLLEL
jgi:hypothetical protein